MLLHWAGRTSRDKAASLVLMHREGRQQRPGWACLLKFASLVGVGNAGELYMLGATAREALARLMW